VKACHRASFLEGGKAHSLFPAKSGGGGGLREYMKDRVNMRQRVGHKSLFYVKQGCVKVLYRAFKSVWA
jgi:hypothetical protein